MSEGPKKTAPNGSSQPPVSIGSPERVRWHGMGWDTMGWDTMGWNIIGGDKQTIL